MGAGRRFFEDSTPNQQALALPDSAVPGSVTNDARIMSLAVRAAQAIHVGVLLTGPSAPKSQYVLSGEFALGGQR
jgi:hypothetical protein